MSGNMTVEWSGHDPYLSNTYAVQYFVGIWGRLMVKKASFHQDTQAPALVSGAKSVILLAHGKNNRLVLLSSALKRKLDFIWEVHQITMAPNGKNSEPECAEGPSVKN